MASRLRALVVGDVKKIFRDDIRAIMSFVPIFLTVLVRFGVPPFTRVILPYFDLADYHLVILTVLTGMTPMMYGWLIGFLLLDDRDEKTLMAIAVTPLTKNGYLAYKITSLMILSLVLKLVLMPLTGLSGFNYSRFLPVSIMASLEAPLVALALAAFAGNKAEGLAMAKFLSLLNGVPVLPFFITSPLVYIAGIVPFFWLGTAILAFDSPWPVFWAHVLAGLVVHLVWLVVLLRIFDRRVE